MKAIWSKRKRIYRRFIREQYFKIVSEIGKISKEELCSIKFAILNGVDYNHDKSLMAKDIENVISRNCKVNVSSSNGKWLVTIK